MSDERSEDDDDLVDLLSYDPFSKENCTVMKSYDDVVIANPLEQKDQSGDDSLDILASKRAVLVSVPNVRPEQLLWYIVGSKKISSGNSKTKRCKRSPTASLDSHSELLHSPASNEMYYPCRKCEPSEAIGLNMPEHFDRTTKTMIQYIGLKLGDRQIVINRRLFPYHNCAVTCKNEEIDKFATAFENDSISLPWCQVLCRQYEKQCQRKYSLSELEARAEIKYLERVSIHAMIYQKYCSQQQMERRQEDLSLVEEEKGKASYFSTKELSGDDELDVPYTQDWGDGKDNNGFYATSSSGPKEPLRPGDVISYRSHLFVAGDKRGERVATIVQVRPKEEPILCLDNNEVLLSTTQVKRIRVMKRGVLEEHPHGLYREIQEFKLQKAGPLPGYQKSTEARRLGMVMQRFNDQYMEIAEKQGMPIDLMNRYQGSKVTNSKLDATVSFNKCKEYSINCSTSSAKEKTTVERKEPGLQNPSQRRKKCSKDLTGSCIAELSPLNASSKKRVFSGDDDKLSIHLYKSSLLTKSKSPREDNEKKISQVSMISSSQKSAPSDSDLEIRLGESKINQVWNNEQRSSNLKTRRKDNAKVTVGSAQMAYSAVDSLSTRSRNKSMSDLVDAKTSIYEGSSLLTVTRRK